MSVKILIKRRFKKQSLENAQEMLIKARTNAMDSKGYISTETLVNYDDPQSFIILSMWQNKEDWDNYRYSSTRKEHEEKYADIFEGPAEYDIYRVGL